MKQLYSSWYLSLTLFLELFDVVLTMRSVFYQPTPGLLKESWITNKGYNLGEFDKLSGYPDCPPLMENKDRFEWSLPSTSLWHHFRLRSYFVSPLSGEHRFILACREECELALELQPGDVRKIYHKTEGSASIGWDRSKQSDAYTLIKGFRYKLDVKFYDGPSLPYFIMIGVLLPNGTEVKPLDGRLLRRSMEFYKLDGVLVERFDNIVYPSPMTVAGLAQTNSAKYPNNPSKVFCKSSLFDTNTDTGSLYARRYVGYMRPSQKLTYTISGSCNSFAEFSLVKENNEVASFYCNKITNGLVEVGELRANKYYKMDITLVEGAGTDYLRTQWKASVTPYQSWQQSWNGMLANLLFHEYYLSILMPFGQPVNSTAISVELKSVPILPQGDQWSANQSYKIIYHKTSDSSRVVSVNINGPLPIRINVTGLAKYTAYYLYAHYYGFIKTTIEHNIISHRTYIRTKEDVPEDFPPDFQARKISSTVVELQWGFLGSDTRKNGIIIGYSIKYAVKDSTPKEWLYHNVTSAFNRILRLESLKKYTIYEFYVAGKTSVGVGVYSPAVEERTAEDVPSAPPANIQAYNTSSTSIRIAWDDVPSEHRNGIITGYKVRIRRSHSGEFTSVDVTSKFYDKTGLANSVSYDVRVAAKTSIGDGVESGDIQVRTDEDLPGGAPQNLVTTAESSSSIRLAWSDIDPSQRNGIILSYEIKYQRHDKQDALKTATATEKYVILTSLDKYIEYDMSVAGATRIGTGIFSSTVKERTLEDAPSEAPMSLAGDFVNATAIYIAWNLIPVHGQNGIIRWYNIMYKRNETTGDWVSKKISSVNLRVEIGDLAYYTMYAVKVAGETNKGVGPFTAPVFIRTDAYGPTKSPSNLNGTFVNHTSIMIYWSRVPEQNRHGIITGYKLSYADATSKDTTWINKTIPNVAGSNDDIFNVTLAGLKIYTPYHVKILAFTYRGEGPFSENFTVWTDSAEPEEVPKNITKGNKTSTEISFSWEPMGEVHDAANGKVTGYRIRYQVVDCYKDRPVGCNESEVFTIMTPDAQPHISIPGLRKFTNYSIRIQVVNDKGSGNFTKPIYLKTAEDTADEPPEKFESWPSENDKITIYWSPIKESHRNGIIIGYRIFYKPIDVPLRDFKRIPRSVSQLAENGALPGEKIKEVNATTFQTEIDDLKEYSWYQIRIGGVTLKGLGATITINGTCKQGAPVEAPTFEVFDSYGFYEISLKWNNISRLAARGEVLGYRIHYWPIEQNDLPIFEGKISHIDVLEPNRSVAIKNLEPYTTYGVIMSAFTEGGYGVLSEHKKAETCKCPKKFTSAWTQLPPIIKENRSITGIIPKYIDEAVTSCCGNCTFGQGPSSIDWVHDVKNDSALKPDRSFLMSSIINGTHIAFPFFRDTIDIEGSSSTLFDYVPILQSPGMMLFNRKQSPKEIGNEGAGKLIDSLLSLYTVLVVQVLFIAVAGIIFWILERGDNSDEFPDDFFYGTGSGIWLAFITMTTAGYGDIAPKTKAGRIFAIVWTLVGIVLTSLIIGQIVNSLFSSTVGETTSRKPTSTKVDKVMVSNETLMIAITKLRKRVTIGNTSNAELVKRTLLSETVAKVIIEAYEAGTMKEELEHPDILFDKLEPVDASYGVLLSREARRMKSCFKRYVKENSQNILTDLAHYTVSFKTGSSMGVAKMPVIVSSEADLTNMLIKYGGITLLVLTIIGSIYDLSRYIRKRHKKAAEQLPAEILFNEVDKLVEELNEHVSVQAEVLENKHTSERYRLVRMDIKDLKAMMPDLTIFHDDLREKEENQIKLQKYDKNQMKKYSESQWNQAEVGYDSDTVDMPMDYKISEG